jgi:hypothetical protein
MATPIPNPISNIDSKSILPVRRRKRKPGDFTNAVTAKPDGTKPPPNIPLPDVPQPLEKDSQPPLQTVPPPEVVLSSPTPTPKLEAPKSPASAPAELEPPKSEPVPTRPAPGRGKKRPPPMKLKDPKLDTTANAPPVDSSLLAVSNGPCSAPASGSARMTYHTTLSNTLANLQFDLRNEDLKELQELGQGNGGSVKKVEHIPTQTIMAKKVCANYTLVKPGTNLFSISDRPY